MRRPFSLTRRLHPADANINMQLAGSQITMAENFENVRQPGDNGGAAASTKMANEAYQCWIGDKAFTTKGTPEDMQGDKSNMTGGPDMSMFDQAGPGQSGPEPGAMSDTLPTVTIDYSSMNNQKAEASEEAPERTPCVTS